MKGSGTIIMIRDLHEIQGKSVSQIAAELNLSRNMVRKFLRGDVSPDKRTGSKRGSKLDPCRQKIEALIQEGIYNSVVIFERLVEIGYDGKRSILKDYLKPLNSAAIVQHTYKACMGVMSLSNKHSAVRLERAAKLACQRSKSPTYRMVKDILIKEEDLAPAPILEEAERPPSGLRGHRRGAAYYGGGRHAES